MANQRRKGVARITLTISDEMLAMIEAEAGIVCTFHDLRRTFASLHVSSGTSVYKVAKWLSDSVTVVENHYGHLIPEDGEINRAWG